jgi:spermidine synthase
VQDRELDQPQASRALYNGRVLHGMQMTDPATRRTPTTYYAAGSGVAVAFEEHPRRLANLPLKAAVVGLGVGTVAAWGRAGDEIVFYELNPAILDFARRYFTFLDDSPARTRVVLGDARLSLEHEMIDSANHGTYDLIAVDAFSGDAVPVHLLTRECFDLYLRALAPSGVLAIHISNRHLDLGPPVRGLVAEAGLSAVEVRTANTDGNTLVSDWVLISADAGFLERAMGRGGVRLGDQPQVVWTDHYNSIVRLLR